VDPIPERVRHRLREARELHIPELCDIEVASALRRLVRSGQLTRTRVHEVVANYAALPLTRHRHLGLVPRVLELSDNFTAYDAAYVALAEQLGSALLTSDAALARAVRNARGLAITLAD
jgi:predicted nucleic acid-binding protein